MSNTQDQATAPDLDALWRQWRDQAVENWAWMAGQAASGEAFVQTGTAALDCYLASARKVRETVGQSLDSMEIPRRSDLARLSTQVLTVESRVADVDDRIDGIRQDVAGLSSQVQAVEARMNQVDLGVQSIRQLLEDVRSSLDTLKDFEARLAGLERALDPSARPGAEAPPEPARANNTSSKTRRRKTP